MTRRSLRTARPSGASALFAAACAGALLVCSLALPAGASPVRPPLESAASSPTDSWVILPMGHPSQQANTFWQVLHTTTSSRRWAVVTPPGVADNGGLDMGVSGSSALVGFVPSGRLRFSPLSLSNDAGGAWSPAFLPVALAPEPDALALAAGNQPTALAVAGGRVLSTRVGLSSWKPLVSMPALRRASPRCGATGPEAAAYSASGAPMVATGCTRGGVGIFTRSAGRWRAEGPMLSGTLLGTSTTVLRLETAGARTSALVEADRRGRRWLVALWRAGSASGWSVSPPLALRPGGTIVATALGSNGFFAVVTRTTNARAVETVAPGRTWTLVAAPPAGVVALAWTDLAPAERGGPTVDAFSVNGTALTVFALAPSGKLWVKVQTAQVPLAFGSSG